ncbi:hypothetical protein GCM10010285_61250 [Streptomyces pseudogriseolus]|uniref:Uncharacterized protein n=1 Tax=Streptomyces pseudogriseolus TaxID=36817 RepID=A0ABQ2TLY8_STREZ|nr:hypothetical protein GCM10010285_61250 [Streptomyces rubiginosus]
MQAEDGLNEAGNAGGRAPQSAEEPPGLEGGDSLLDQGPDLRMGPGAGAYHPGDGGRREEQIEACHGGDGPPRTYSSVAAMRWSQGRASGLPGSCAPGAVTSGSGSR